MSGGVEESMEKLDLSKSSFLLQRGFKSPSFRKIDIFSEAKHL